MAAEKQEILDIRSMAGAAILLSLTGLCYIALALPLHLAVLKFDLLAVSIGICAAYVLVGAAKEITWSNVPILTKLAPVHWVQMMVQGSILVFLSFHSRALGQQAPLIFFQILFAINVDLLCSLYFYRTIRLNLSAFPIVLSFNLFLWFRPDFFLLQLCLIGLGVLSKYIFTWQRDGVRVHIFNPSGIAMFFGTLLALYWREISAVGKISGAYSSSRPYVFMFIFLVGLASLTLGRVALVTLGSVVTMFLIDRSSIFLAGEPLMTTWISPSLLVGMTLLVTDPATTPKGPRGQFLYGVAYAATIVGSYALLCYIHALGYYSKIMFLPFLNLAVKWFDRFDPKPSSPPDDTLAWSNLRFSALYAAVFMLLYNSIVYSPKRTSVFGRLGGDEWAEMRQR